MIHVYMRIRSSQERDPPQTTARLPQRSAPISPLTSDTAASGTHAERLRPSHVKIDTHSNVVDLSHPEPACKHARTDTRTHTHTHNHAHTQAHTHTRRLPMRVCAHAQGSRMLYSKPLWRCGGRRMVRFMDRCAAKFRPYKIWFRPPRRRSHLIRHPSPSYPSPSSWAQPQQQQC